MKHSERRLTRVTILVVLCTAIRLAGTPAFAARPNILFFFPDQHRFDWTSMNPELPNITPNLKKLAARGVRFTKALTPAPVCAPARACLASGKEYARCRVASNGVPYPVDQTTFYTLLRRAGYRVLGCGKFDLDKPGMNWGLDGQHRHADGTTLLDLWGFSAGIDNAGKMDGVNAYRSKPRKPEPYFAFLGRRNLVDAFLKNYRLLDHDYPGKPVLPDDAYTDNWIAQNGLDLIRSVPRGEPWFLQINFNGPHSPMDVTKSMYEKWKGAVLPEPRAGNGRSKPASRRNYAAMISNIDRWLPIFEQELARRGDLENTLLVYCSDHGEMLGDHGLGGKSQPYQPSASVPLVVAGPGVRQNVTCGKPVETLDLTATFLDFAGLPCPNDMDFRSLRPYLERGDDLPRSFVISSLGGWALVFDGRYKLVVGNWKYGKNQGKGKNSEPLLVLYDLENDPAETVNIADQRPDIVKKFKPLLPPVQPYKNSRKSNR